MCYLYYLTFAVGKWADNHYEMQKVVDIIHEMPKYKPNLSCQPINSPINYFYEISDICSYRVNKQGQIFPCNEGEHLQNCEKFECNMMFKCPNFYCIPWEYICDGKWDCPGGYDESAKHQCRNRTCTNMFKCKMSSTCIHLGDVCNGFVDCPYGDDEYSCLLKCATCPAVCQCLGFVINCYNTNISVFTLPTCFPYIFVKIVNCRLFSESKLQMPFQNVTLLSITNTNLQYICQLVSLMKYVLVLDAGKNDINQIHSHCFENKVALRVVKLNSNKLQHIQKFAFHKLISLLYIDLSNNMLTLIPEYFIALSDSLSFISIKDNPLDAELNKATIIKLNMNFFLTSHFSLCCFASKNVKCSFKKPWYVSCSQLLLTWPTKFTFYCITLAILVTNIFSIYLVVKDKKGRHNKSDTTGVFNTIATVIGIVDITGSVPLFILWLSDLFFKSSFVLQRNQWQCSLLCFISGGINIHFVMASTFLHVLLSLTRYMVVKHPFDTKFKKSEFSVKLITIGYLSSLFLATLITILFWVIYGKMSTVYCSSFLDPSRTFIMTETLTFVIICIHFLAFLLNLAVHIKLVVTVTRSEGVHSTTNCKRSHNKPLIIQIICITCSHMLCWISDMIIYLIIYFMKNYSMEMILHKLACISPLNSILIPIILGVNRLKS